MLQSFVGVALALLSLVAHADSDLPPAVGSVEIKEVPYRHPQNQVIPTCGNSSAFSSAHSGVNELLDLGLGDIITIGNTLWNIVNAGKPVVTLTTPEASALPRNITCWTDLDSWKPTSMHAFEVTYKNLLHAETVKFGYALHYTYGGGKDGVGKYLANVTIMPTDLSVAWGYTFDAAVEAEQAVNVGTSSQPVAGIEINLKWTVKTVFTQSVNTISYFVQGDGVMINNSNSM